MIDVNRALQPLDEAARSIALLQTYESSAELASALQATHAAVQRTLRSLLRSDRGAPDDLRMAALSPTELTPDRLIPALRQRDLISLQLAGHIHELELANERAGREQVRAADADHALRVVDQLREEINAHAERDMRTVAHSAVTTHALEDEPHIVPASGPARKPLRIAVSFAVVAIIGVLLWALLLRDSPTDKAIAAYNAGRYMEAQQIFQQEIDDDVGNTTAAFYLARLYRREKRYDDARRVLQRALDEAENAYLRAEAGNLFLEVGQPQLAVRQLQRAVELDPETPRNWVALVRAMRAAGDPNAEATLRQAPAEARALLR